MLQLHSTHDHGAWKHQLPGCWWERARRMTMKATCWANRANLPTGDHEILYEIRCVSKWGSLKFHHVFYSTTIRKSKYWGGHLQGWNTPTIYRSIQYIHLEGRLSYTLDVAFVQETMCTPRHPHTHTHRHTLRPRAWCTLDYWKRNLL